MNSIAGFIGWLVIWASVTVVAGVALGKLLKFLGRDQPSAPEPEDWDPAPRTLAPHVPAQWRRFNDEDLRDTTPHPPAS